MFTIRIKHSWEWGIVSRGVNGLSNLDRLSLRISHMKMTGSCMMALHLHDIGTKIEIVNHLYILKVALSSVWEGELPQRSPKLVLLQHQNIKYGVFVYYVEEDDHYLLQKIINIVFFQTTLQKCRLDGGSSPHDPRGEDRQVTHLTRKWVCFCQKSEDAENPEK